MHTFYYNIFHKTLFKCDCFSFANIVTHVNIFELSQCIKLNVYDNDIYIYIYIFNFVQK